MRDLTGQRFGRLIVLEFDHKKDCNKGANYYWKCLCDCGKEKIIPSSSLRSGATQSCGCLCKERHHLKHKMWKSKIYGVWNGMKQRCTNPNCREYKNYGARGIEICEEWNDSKNFIDWALANGYQEGLSIDRIDYDGNYEPSNCRWSDAITQANNTRRNKVITINGEKHSVAEWSRINQIPYSYVYKRIAIGWDYERALTEPIRRIKNGR